MNKLSRVVLPAVVAVAAVVIGSVPAVAVAPAPFLRLYAERNQQGFYQQVNAQPGCVTLDQPTPTLSAANLTRRYDAHLFTDPECEDSPVASIRSESGTELRRQQWVASVYFEQIG